MLYSSKVTLAKELGVSRDTITRMIARGEVKRLEAPKGRKYYVHIINHIRELVGNNG